MLIIAVGEKFQILEDFFTLPCESSKLNIYKASNLGPLQYWYLREVAYKCMRLKLNDNKYVVFPLLHS